MHQYFYFAWIVWWDKTGSYRETGMDGWSVRKDMIDSFNWSDFRKDVGGAFAEAQADVKSIHYVQIRSLSYMGREGQ